MKLSKNQNGEENLIGKKEYGNGVEIGEGKSLNSALVAQKTKECIHLLQCQMEELQIPKDCIMKEEDEMRKKR